MKIDEKIKQYGVETGVPISKDDTLVFLCKLIDENNAKKILEIGTAIGFGTITISENTSCEHIDTVEIDESRFKIANENIKKCGLENRISTYLIDAMDYLKKCRKKYDLVYLDGPKNQYINYLPWLMKIVKKGGLIVSDNLYFHGMVLGKIPVTTGCRAMIKSLHKYIGEITTNPRLETLIYEIGDGVGVTKIKR